MKFLSRLGGIFKNDKLKEDGNPRILAYCASNIGMGHYCRLLRVLEGVKKQAPKASILLATDTRDSTLTARLGVAVLQLPRFRFLDHEKFKEGPELLNINAKELKDIRSDLLLSLGRSYRPHVLLMDTNPHGKRDEVLPLLKHLRHQQDCRTLLMMRDIPSPPGEPFKLSTSESMIRKHGSYYDRLLLAGDERFFDAATAYQWPDDIRAKMAYLGFVIPTINAKSRPEVFATYPQLDPSRPTLVVSFGGGWQVDHYGPQVLGGLGIYRARHQRKVQMVMAVGPALLPDHYRAIKAQADALGGIVIEHFSPHFSQLLAHSDLAILQAGSVPFQVLETDIPILLTHRPYKSREQEERAVRLARWSGIRLVKQDDVTAEECAEWIEWGLSQSRVKRVTGYSFNGITNAAQEVVQAMDGLIDRVAGS